MKNQVKCTFVNIDKQKWMTHGVMFGIFVLTCMVTLIPESAFAAVNVSGMDDVFKKIEGILKGPWGKAIAIAGMGIIGTFFIFARQDMHEGFKLMLQVMFGICFLVFAANFISIFFETKLGSGASGALI